MKTHCEPWSGGLGVWVRGWEPSRLAIFMLPALPSDVTLLVSQETGRDITGEEGGGRRYAATLEVQRREVSTYPLCSKWNKRLMLSIKLYGTYVIHIIC